MDLRRDEDWDVLGEVSGLPKQVVDLAVLGVERLPDVLDFDDELDETGVGPRRVECHRSCVVKRSSGDILAAEVAHLSHPALGIEPDGASSEMLEGGGNVALRDLAAQFGRRGPFLEAFRTRDACDQPPA